MAGAYSLTDAGQWLRDDHPQGVRASIDLEGAIGHADMCMVELLYSVRSGEQPFPAFRGRVLGGPRRASRQGRLL